MDKYTASNGMQIAADGHPFALINRNGITTQTFSADDADALREFFRAEEDERLGRWRWPENPDYVVYPPVEDRPDIAVFRESTGDHWEGAHEIVAGAEAEDSVLAARAYFDAHPEPMPIPNEPRSAWVDKYGTDVWVVGGDGVLRCVSSRSSDPAKYAPFTRMVPEVSQ